MTSKEIVELLCELVDLKELTNRGLILKDINRFQNQLEKDLEVLEQYKKIEEELGIDLITLFKFFKKEMVFKTSDNRYNIYHAYPSCDRIALTRTSYGWALQLKWFRDYDYYYLKDFNKTFRFSTKTAIGKYWALKNGGTKF